MVDYRRWYKDRDFTEIKVSNSEILAVVPDEKQLLDLIERHNAVLQAFAEARVRISIPLEKQEQFELISHKLEYAVSSGKLPPGSTLVKDFTWLTTELRAAWLSLEKIAK